MDYEGYIPQQISGSAPSPGSQAMDMRSLAGALPEYQTRPYPQQSFQQMGGPGSQSQGLVYQLPPGAQFAGQAGGAMSVSTAHQYPQHYAQSPQQRQGNFGSFVAVPGQQQSFQNAGHLSMHQNTQGHMQQFLHTPSPNQYGPSFATRGYQQQLRVSPTGHGMYHNSAQHGVTRTSSNSSIQAASSSVLRGPPRKPKQSGHALWVGNLPPGTHINDLKDHFSREATRDIDSVFLISKSNCAFVNYKTEESCQAAMSRFHDSRFQNVRLVCRLRRGSSSSTPATPQNPAPSDTAFETTAQEQEDSVNTGNTINQPPAPQEKVKEKYFVVKSLTTEDLERSVQSGVWATQAHNEVALSNAYESAEDVYLIFSANKSGEYFGYARMDSAIGDEEAAARTEIHPPSPPPVATGSSTTDAPPSSTSGSTLHPQSATSTHSANHIDVPLTIFTPPTTTAPRGRIIDDSSRGTIFWEADPAESPTSSSSLATPEEPSSSSTKTPDDTTNTTTPNSNSPTPTGPPPAAATTFGKPFKITWLSTDRLPFYRTRGLRNPWNANREVKIARDGTEIEPSVGRRLVGMFGMAFPPTGPGAQMVGAVQQHHQQQQQHGMVMMGGGGRGGMVPVGMVVGMQHGQQGGGGMYVGHGGGGGMMGPGQGGYGRGY